MDLDGYYEGEFGALFRRGQVRLCIQDGRVAGATQRGTVLTGCCWVDPARQTHRYEVVAHVPPFFELITGIMTGAKGRSIPVRGEATPMENGTRFSFDLAGRAIDVLLKRVGPVEMGADLLEAANGSPVAA